MPKSFEIHVGLDLESDFKKCLKTGERVSDALIKKIEHFTSDSKLKLEQNSKRKHNFNLNLKDKMVQNIKDNARNKLVLKG
jgi:hypothetical protein